MKVFISLLVLVMANTSLAKDFECSKKVSDTRTEGAFISSYPYLNVSTGFRDCQSSGGMGSCSAGILDLIADDYRVCFQSVRTQKDCTVNEGPTSLEITCANGYILSFSMGDGSNGQIVCSEKGVPRKTWDVGSCKAK